MWQSAKEPVIQKALPFQNVFILEILLQRDNSVESLVVSWSFCVPGAGLIWAEVKQLWDEGVKAYVQDMWNILDFTTNSFYVATFSVKLVAYLRVRLFLKNLTSKCQFVFK